MKKWHKNGHLSAAVETLGEVDKRIKTFTYKVKKIEGMIIITPINSKLSNVALKEYLKGILKVVQKEPYYEVDMQKLYITILHKAL